MKLRSLLARGTAAVLLASGVAVAGSTLTSAPASAASGACRPSQAGDVRTVWGKVQRSFILTDAERYEIARGTSAQRRVTFSTTRSRTNQVTASVEASAEFGNKLFAKAEVKVGVEYGHARTTSTHQSRTDVVNFDRPGNYYAAQGFEFFKVTWANQRCVRPHIGADRDEYIWKTSNNGRIAGFDTVTGTVRCGDSYGASTFRRFVSDRRC